MHSIIEYLFPPRCPLCDGVRPIGEPVCHPTCRSKVFSVGEYTCMKCGKPVADEGREYCYDCEVKKHSFTTGVSTFVYEDTMQKSMLRFKYHGRVEYADWYVAELWKKNATRLKAFGADWIVPVPVHKVRYRKRGYNQAAVLAKKLGEYMDVPVAEHLLKRGKRTTAQKQLNDRERLRNLLDAFELSKSVIKKMRTTPKRVILIDDIYTTGSTLEACTRVLRKAGVTDVCVATICTGSGYT